MNSIEFYKQAINFLDKVFLEMESHRIEIKNYWMIDHICYRVETEKNYQKMKSQFEHLGSLLIESEVNGRLIASYKLHQPISYKDYQIPLVELPAPKIGKKVV